jgi:hypothetical protein
MHQILPGREDRCPHNHNIPCRTEGLHLTAMLTSHYDLHYGCTDKRRNLRAAK